MKMADQNVDCTDYEKPEKQIKIDTEENSNKLYTIHDDLNINLSNFEMKQVLNINNTSKSIFLEGAFKGYDSQAVVILEKKVFPEEELFLKRGFFNEGSIIRKAFNNDVYGKYECFPTREYNGLNVTIIHPATQKHIDKFMRKELHIVNETYENYKNITLPHIESSHFSLKWVDNILNGSSEKDRIFYDEKNEDTGFVLLHDLKWDGNPSTLNIMALARKRLKSLRELNDSHLPLLKNILKKGSNTISKKFNIPTSQLRIYLHYQPSYYHLHVHFTSLMNDAPGIFCEKAHLLTTVINNIEILPDYYQKAELSFVLKEDDELLQKFIDNGVVPEIKKTTNNEQ